MHLQAPTSLLRSLPLLLLATTLPATAALFEVTVTVTNSAPATGTMLTPVWVGFHNGMYDLFDVGSAASPSLARLAEDGDLGPLRSNFASSANAGTDGVVFGLNPAPPIFRPSDINSVTFMLDSTNPLHTYFSYASMVIPSNDAFIGNGSPTTFRIFDANGAFMPTAFTVTGDRVWDAGTEVNDEIPANTAAFGQTVADTGVDEFGLITVHPGFIPNGAILAAFPGADFTAQGYQVAQFSITGTAIPEPSSTAALAGVFALIFLILRRPGRN